MSNRGLDSLAPKLSHEEYAYVLRNDFASFIHRSFYELHPDGRLDFAPHIEVMATKLEAVRRGTIKQLIVCLPPRHLKSHCASVAFPAWLLAHNPTLQIICASYGQDLADELADDCRRLMQSPLYKTLFGNLLSGRQAVSDFGTTQRGRRLATSVGGVLTGRGADVLIIDDPQKADDALSESSRKAAHTWYDNTLSTRLNDRARGSIIIIAQRLHQDDLIGHVLEHGDWDVLSFPAIAEQDECHLIESPFGSSFFRRQIGDILHPQRDNAASLENARRNISAFTFSAQYQQNPIPLGGAIVKTDWLRYYEPGEEPAQFEFILQSWDTANKSGELNDFSVCTTWGIVDDRFYLLDVCRKRLNFPELKREVIRLAERFRPHGIIVEDKASGTQLVQDLQNSIWPPVTAYKPPAGADKAMRLHAQSAVFENGRVFLPKAAPWLADYITELTGFPGSRHADQVDSTTQALDYIRSNSDAFIWARLAAKGD